MDGAAGEADGAALRVTFDHRLKLEFHGSKVTSDAGLLPFRGLNDALGLTDLAGEVLADTRTGQNSRHTLIAQLRQSVFGRLAGYEDVNDAERLGRDPAMRCEAERASGWLPPVEWQGSVRNPSTPGGWNGTEASPEAVHPRV